MKAKRLFGMGVFLIAAGLGLAAPVALAQQEQSEDAHDEAPPKTDVSVASFGAQGLAFGSPDHPIQAAPAFTASYKEVTGTTCGSEEECSRNSPFFDRILVRIIAGGVPDFSSAGPRTGFSADAQVTRLMLLKTDPCALGAGWSTSLSTGVYGGPEPGVDGHLDSSAGGSLGAVCLGRDAAVSVLVNLGPRTREENRNGTFYRDVGVSPSISAGVTALGEQTGIDLNVAADRTYWVMTGLKETRLGGSIDLIGITGHSAGGRTQGASVGAEGRWIQISAADSVDGGRTTPGWNYTGWYAGGSIKGAFTGL